MKKIVNFSLILCCIFSLLFTSCIEETFPTDGATKEQVDKSPKAIEALFWGMPAMFNHFRVLNTAGLDYDWGYGSLMHIRDVMTGDMAVAASGYDHYSAWADNQAQGESYQITQFIWYYHWKFVQAPNTLISVIDPATATDDQLGYLGAGYAFRALVYLDMARMFEFLPNDKTSSINAAGKNVLNLTVPIVKENITEAEARNNPRATRQQMFDFILSDLDSAEVYIDYLARANKTLPDLSVVYGLKARLYMWVEDYPKAKEYARKAINAGSYTPTTKDQWLNTATGFNEISTPSWMWGVKQERENKTVTSGILNWTSWMSNETDFGYAGAGPYPMIDAQMYSNISNSDFRKFSFKAPAGSPIANQVVWIDPSWSAYYPEYVSLKFRPGGGDMYNTKVGTVTSYPVMRIEEMYFIEAEAAAHTNPAEGKTLVEAFMQTYRYPSYVCTASATEDVVNEIVFQKRVELWGEGQAFYDIKRLNLPVTRSYTGTNHAEGRRFNTTTRPAWMNFCIVRSEKNNNTALVGYENPDPSDLYTDQ